MKQLENSKILVISQYLVLLVAYIPGSDYWRPNTLKSEYAMHLKESSDLKINFIDGSDIIDTRDLENYAPLGPHLSKEGYKKFTELLLSHLGKK